MKYIFNCISNHATKQRDCIYLIESFHISSKLLFNINPYKDNSKYQTMTIETDNEQN